MDLIPQTGCRLVVLFLDRGAQLDLELFKLFLARNLAIDSIRYLASVLNGPVNLLEKLGQLPAEDPIVLRAPELAAGSELAIGEPTIVTLELFGTAGLLRSLAVAPDFRGGGLGTRLCRALIRRATELGVERLFLLTLDAEPFFARLGFVECERASAPANLAASRQFASGVCSTATCLALDLTQLVDVDALQDRYPGNHCFGCGPANERGLQLKSHRSGDITVARFRPSPEHNAGPEAWLNGGIAATLVDCHSVFTAIADAFEREGRPFASVPLIWYVTGSLSVRYERPVPIDAEVRLEARIRATAGRKTTVDCTLSSGDEVCANTSRAWSTSWLYRTHTAPGATVSR